MVNIREHDSWVHTDRAEATAKAKALAHAARLWTIQNTDPCS